MKKTFTKMLVLILCASSILSLSGCGKSDESGQMDSKLSETLETTLLSAETSAVSQESEASENKNTEGTKELEEPGKDEAENGSDESSEIAEAAFEENTVPRLQGGPSLVEAVQIPLNIKIYGTLQKNKEAQWFSFTTTDKVNASYAITLVNKTPGTEPVVMYVYTENGVCLSHGYGDDKHSAFSKGIAHSETFELEASTSYYFQLYSKDITDFMFFVTDPSEAASANVMGTAQRVSDVSAAMGGHNQDDAAWLPLHTKVYGTTEKNGIRQWFSFTTTDKVNASYAITLVNKTFETEPVLLFFYDAYGNRLSKGYGDDKHSADYGGRAHTEIFELDPNTSYYLFICSEDIADFMLFVTDPSEAASMNLLGTGAAAKDTFVLGGSNQDDANLLSLSTRYYGKTDNNGRRQWFSFTTADKANASYTITLIHKSPEAKPLILYVYDEYGTCLSKGYGDDKHSAYNSGRAHSETFELDPSTNYYLFLCSEDITDFMIHIADPSEMTGVNFLSSSDMAKDAYCIAGGSDQDAATLLPLNTNLYGTSRSGINAWYSFTTTDKENASYAITLIHKTVGADPVIFYVYDKFGTCISQGYGDDKHSAYNGGRAHTEVFELPPSTTFYIAITSGNTADFMIRVKDPSEKTCAISTATSISESLGTSGVLDGTILPGTNQDDSAMIPLGIAIMGTVRDQLNSWLSFTTTGKENATYTITLEHRTPDAKAVIIYVYDEYGTCLSKGYGDDRHAAYQNGTLHSETFALDPDTTYYIRLWSEDVADYTLFSQQDGFAEENTEAVMEQKQDPLVFEIPFELTETQVHFVGDEAVFVDRNAAIAALSPVAEIILAHPDHTILLAGTTATFGCQESCVTLSKERAEAVKNLLVTEFGVPEEQLLTIGLGFEADPFVRGRDRDAGGNFVETEAAKNRRVVVLDAEDPIAKQLLGVE